MSLEPKNQVRNEKNILQFILFFTLSLFVLLLVSGFLEIDNSSSNETVERPSLTENKEPQIFGLSGSAYTFDTHIIKQNQFLGEILSDYEISFKKVNQLVQSTKEIFSVRSFRANKPIVFARPDECSPPEFMFYEIDKLTYVKYHFEENGVNVEKVVKPFEVCENEAHGIIKSSLSDAMDASGLGMSLVSKMEDALASSVDFYHIQKNDEFKLVFEEIYIDGELAAYGDVLGAFYKNEQGEHYSLFFENDKYSGFYDFEGRPTKGAFLRAPVKFSRISSRFNRNRFHPIKKRRIPHLGTDYAAPTGTPIFSVSDGVVTAVSRTKNNGKYVKIRHDKTYETQYLHMNGFAKGIKKGVKVKQGQTIGFVGMTGLATGPHVCFRFWKNGKQCNHLRENFPPADPLPESDMPQFLNQAQIIKSALDNITRNHILSDSSSLGIDNNQL